MLKLACSKNWTHEAKRQVNPVYQRQNEYNKKGNEIDSLYSWLGLY